MSRPTFLPLLLTAAAALCAGCRIMKVGVLAVAAVVGVAGYAVYKTGDMAVTGVTKAGEAVASGSKSAVTVLYANGELTVEYPFDVRTVWSAANLALIKANFSEVSGSYDAISGALTAKTRENVTLALKLRITETRSTEVRIRVGVKGDLKTAELINGLILRQLPTPAPAAGVPAALEKEVKR